MPGYANAGCRAIQLSDRLGVGSERDNCAHRENGREGPMFDSRDRPRGHVKRDAPLPPPGLGAASLPPLPERTQALIVSCRSYQPSRIGGVMSLPDS